MLRRYPGRWLSVSTMLLYWACVSSTGHGQVILQREFVRTGSADYEILAQPEDPSGTRLRAMNGGADTLLIRTVDGAHCLVRYLQHDGSPADGWIARNAVGASWMETNILSMTDEPAGTPIIPALTAIRENPHWNRIDRLLLSSGQIRYGMSQDQIVTAFGEPEGRNRFRTAAALFEQLTYRLPAGGQFLLICENGRLADHKMIDAAPQLGRVGDTGLLRITPELHPHRATGISLMTGGAILIGAGWFLFNDYGDLTSQSKGDVRTMGTIVITLGVASEITGIYLFQYTRKVQSAVLPLHNGVVMNLRWTF